MAAFNHVVMEQASPHCTCYWDDNANKAFLQYIHSTCPDCRKKIEALHREKKLKTAYKKNNEKSPVWHSLASIKDEYFKLKRIDYGADVLKMITGPYYIVRGNGNADIRHIDWKKVGYHDCRDDWYSHEVMTIDVITISKQDADIFANYITRHDPESLVREETFDFVGVTKQNSELTGVYGYHLKTLFEELESCMRRKTPTIDRIYKQGKAEYIMEMRAIFEGFEDNINEKEDRKKKLDLARSQENRKETTCYCNTCKKYFVCD